MLPGVTCHCYAAMLINFRPARAGFGQQKSRINKDPAEFDWKCLLRLTSRGEHSRALMGGERAQEMNYICAHHAQETSIYFATHACKKMQSVVQPISEPDRTRKSRRNGRARHQSHCGTDNPNRFCCLTSETPNDAESSSRRLFLRHQAMSLQGRPRCEHLRQSLAARFSSSPRHASSRGWCPGW